MCGLCDAGHMTPGSPRWNARSPLIFVRCVCRCVCCDIPMHLLWQIRCVYVAVPTKITRFAALESAAFCCGGSAQVLESFTETDASGWRTVSDACSTKTFVCRVALAFAVSDVRCDFCAAFFALIRINRWEKKRFVVVTRLGINRMAVVCHTKCVDRVGCPWSACPGGVCALAACCYAV